MEGNIYLKAYIYSLIPPFTESVTQFVKMGKYALYFYT